MSWEFTGGRALAGFFVLLVVLAVPFWVAGALTGTTLARGLPLSALMFVVPAVAAAIITYRRAGAGGVRRLWARTFGPGERGRRAWPVAAALLPPALAVVCSAVTLPFGPPNALTAMPLLTAPLLVVVFLLAAACEEAGWTAFATDPLNDRLGPLRTGLLLGVIWGVWHFVPLAQAGHSVVWIAWWFLGTVAARVVIVWLYLEAGRAGPAAVLFHCMLNAAAYNYGPTHALAVSAIVMSVVAAAAALPWRAGVRV
ncbi:CPBP family intramembrane metalloprotease [Nonomuraea deserti]|uniref:CPBP family intramembrane metalloprotease n=1 Tax=Nonomuraea deserti TaxID=1848322 RepID=A0A4R4VJV4_9ACTN|nr:CPBP family glutamic-type intramembrane protease [Nonomuraea deserti]TDD02405.1 CPBP family intramembrane metalloprotease [Nonomuraea deserti]